MYSASVPIFSRMLGNMLVWLDKANAHAQARKFEPNNYVGLRLAPDMLPLGKQIQIASDAAKGCVARLAGVEIPKWEDNETTLAELQDRVRRTLDYVGSVPASAFEGSDTRQITLTLRTGDQHFDGETYLKHFALPNFFFHTTTLYALLRQAGVEIGKTDFLGGR